MAKRMTDTEKWKKPFIKSLPTDLKLLFLYILDDCDHAGVWHVDLEVAEIRLGIKVDRAQAVEKFGEKIVVFDDGSKWFLPDFISFQYGELTEKNRMHKPVMATLTKYNLMGHISPLNGGKVQVQVKVQVKEQVQVQEEEKVKKEEEVIPEVQNERLLVPAMCNIWYSEFPHYTRDMATDFPAMLKIADFIGKQAGVSDITAVDVREKVVNTLGLIVKAVREDSFWVNKPLKSIANNVQEFYNQIKNPINDGKKSGPKAGAPLRSAVQEEFNRRAQSRRQDVG